MDTSMDDAGGSSSANTPIAASPSAETGAGAGQASSTGAASSAADNTEGLLPPRRKRNRPAKSCFQCRQRKIRCDRKYPCGSCIRAKFDNCTYRQPETRSWPAGPVLTPASTAAPHPHLHQQQPLPVPSTTGGQFGTQYHHPPPSYSSQQQQQQPQQHLLPRSTFGDGYREEQHVDSNRAYAGSSGAVTSGLPTSLSAYPSPHSNIASTNGHGAANDTVSGLESVIQQLQQQLAQQGTIIQQLQQGSGRDSKRNDGAVGGSVTSQAGEAGPSSVRGVMSKSRYLGQSHWMNTIRFVSVLGEVPPHASLADTSSSSQPLPELSRSSIRTTTSAIFPSWSSARTSQSLSNRTELGPCSPTT